MATGQIRGIGSYFSQIWHSSDHDSVPFYPLWFNQFLNRKLPVLLDVNNLMLVYASVPILRTIIDKKAEMLMNAKIKLYKVDKDGKKTQVMKHPVLDLLNRPNCLQTGKEFLFQWSLMRDIYGTAFIYKNKPTSVSMPKIMWVLPTGEMKINPTGLLFEQTTVETIIKNYEHINNQYPNAAPRYFEPKEIIRYTDGAADRYFFGISKIVTNKLLVSNLQVALQTRNVLLTDMGAKGILSSASNDGQGGVPLDDPERIRIEKAYRQEYGIDEDQSKIIVTNSNLKFQPIGFPTKDLMTFEEVDACQGSICDMYGMQRQIFAEASVSKAASTIGGDGKGKIEEAMKITYQTTLRQCIEQYLEPFNIGAEFGIASNSMILEGDFSEEPVMQEDQVDAESVRAQKAASAAATTQAIIDLNAAVKAGDMELEPAIAILVNVHEIEEDIAEQLILKPKEIVEPEATPGEAPLTDDQKNYIKSLNLKLKPVQ